MKEDLFQDIDTTLGWAILIVVLILCTSCKSEEAPRAAYVPLDQLETTYGRLISVGNCPTPNQNGTGDLMGLFRDHTGTVWGIPLLIGSDGIVLGCAPPKLRDAPVSGVVPADAVEIVGTANQPTGWRGGTGKLGLLIRDAQGGVRWHPVESTEITEGPKCWSQSEPVQILKHYRLVKVSNH